MPPEKSKRSTPDSLPRVDPSRLDRATPRWSIRGRNLTKADIQVYRLDGMDVAVKDYGSRPWLIRNTVGRLLLRRETRAYRAADGIRGLPRFLGRVGPFRIALEYIDSTPLAELSGARPDDAFFDRVDAVIRSLHARGVALGDLHHRDVLVDRDGGIHLVDLATSLVLGRRPGVLRRRTFRRLAELDRIAVARMRARWTGRTAVQTTAALDRSTVAWHARGRRLKTLLDRLRRRKPRGV